RETAHDTVLDRIDVDGLVKGFADTNVLERVLALDVGIKQLVAQLVHAEEDRAQLRTGLNLGGAAGIDALDVLQRNRLDDVAIARQQRGDAGGIRADRREVD